MKKQIAILLIITFVFVSATTAFLLVKRAEKSELAEQTATAEQINLVDEFIVQAYWRNASPFVNEKDQVYISIKNHSKTATMLEDLVCTVECADERYEVQLLDNQPTYTTEGGQNNRTDIGLKLLPIGNYKPQQLEFVQIKVKFSEPIEEEKNLTACYVPPAMIYTSYEAAFNPNTSPSEAWLQDNWHNMVYPVYSDTLIVKDKVLNNAWDLLEQNKEIILILVFILIMSLAVSFIRVKSFKTSLAFLLILSILGGFFTVNLQTALSTPSYGKYLSQGTASGTIPIANPIIKITKNTAGTTTINNITSQEMEWTVSNVDGNRSDVSLIYKLQLSMVSGVNFALSDFDFVMKKDGETIALDEDYKTATFSLPYSENTTHSFSLTAVCDQVAKADYTDKIRVSVVAEQSF